MFKDCVVRSFLATALLFAWTTADAQERPSRDSLSPVVGRSESLKALPSLPSPTLALPEDSRVAFFYDAVGVQIYACQATASGFAWTFQGPDASLFDRHGKLVVKHYAGPTWESVSDHSKIVAKKVAEFNVRQDAIPELLLQVTSHDGKGSFADVDYIQRLDTTGGISPAAGCDQGHVGATARVDYTATYAFSRPKAHRK